jgi:hypothetical protein
MLFGEIPLTLSSEVPENSIPRASEQEINDFVRADFEEAIALLPTQAVDSVRLTSSVQALQTSEFGRARDVLEAIRNSGLYRLKDINADGIFDANDHYGQNIFFIQALLLYAEASVSVGDYASAIQAVNTPYMQFAMSPLLSQGATQEEILSAIRSFFAVWNDGLKFPNAVRWGETANWNRCALMPIPQQVIEENPLVRQNQGW